MLFSIRAVSAYATSTAIHAELHFMFKELPQLRYFTNSPNFYRDKRYITAHFWDSEEPSLLVCETKTSEGSNVNSNVNNEKNIISDDFLLSPKKMENDCTSTVSLQEFVCSGWNLLSLPGNHVTWLLRPSLSRFHSSHTLRSRVCLCDWIFAWPSVYLLDELTDWLTFWLLVSVDDCLSACFGICNFCCWKWWGKQKRTKSNENPKKSLSATSSKTDKYT